MYHDSGTEIQVELISNLSEQINILGQCIKTFVRLHNNCASEKLHFFRICFFGNVQKNIDNEKRILVTHLS